MPTHFVLSGELDEGRALVLGTLDEDESFGLELQSELAGNLQRIFREGPSAVAEREIYEVLCEEKTIDVFRRRAVPASIAGDLDLVLFDCLLSAKDCYTPQGRHTFVALVIDPEHDGEIHPIPWSVVADLVKVP